jgi:hypothetical protein
MLTLALRAKFVIVKKAIKSKLLNQLMKLALNLKCTYHEKRLFLRNPYGFSYNLGKANLNSELVSNDLHVE